MDQNSKIFVAGHTGLLGSAVLAKLKTEGFQNILTVPRRELDLADAQKVDHFFSSQKPEYVFLAAGKTGGIMANRSYPVEFLNDNLNIQQAVFAASHKHGVRGLIFYASSCVYPKLSQQPMKEDYLFAGPIEETSAPYAAAKIAGIMSCFAYNKQFGTTQMICLLPNSLYGPNDDFSIEGSHVLSALIRKIHDAHTAHQPEVNLWGTGKPCREFLFSADAADASVFAMKNREKLENKFYNLGTGLDFSIQQLAEKIAAEVGYKGQIKFDPTQPDGAPRKLLDSSRFLSLGWKAKTSLEDGIHATYQWFLKN